MGRTARRSKEESSEVPMWKERKAVDMRVRRLGKWLQIEIGTTKLIAVEVDTFKEPRAERKEVPF